MYSAEAETEAGWLNYCTALYDDVRNWCVVNSYPYHGVYSQFCLVHGSQCEALTLGEHIFVVYVHLMVEKKSRLVSLRNQ